MLVDLILADRRYYTFEGYAARHVGAILEESKVPYRLIYLSDGLLQDYLFSLEQTSPTWTLSFSNVTPHHKPLCDVVQIPHFYWAEGSLAPGWHYLSSNYGKVGLSDHSLCHQLRSPRLCYLPFGVEKQRSGQSRQFDVVMFADVIELAALEKTWLEVLDEEAIVQIKQAVAKQDPCLAGKYYFYAEQYLVASQTLHTVQTLSSCKLDIFGEHVGRDWLVRLPTTTHLHASLPFTEHFEVLSSCQIIIAGSSSPWYAPALAAGCLPLPPEPEKVRYFLDHPDQREQEINRLLHTTYLGTWDTQVKQLIEVMSC